MATHPQKYRDIEGVIDWGFIKLCDLYNTCPEARRTALLTLIGAYTAGDVLLWFDAGHPRWKWVSRTHQVSPELQNVEGG